MNKMAALYSQEAGQPGFQTDPYLLEIRSREALKSDGDPRVEKILNANFDDHKTVPRVNSLC